MPLVRPTLEETKRRLAADIDARLPGADARLRRSFLDVLASAVAGAHHEMHGYLEYIERNAFPDTAEAEELERWAEVYGLARHPASAASGDIDVAGSDGTAIPAGTVWQAGNGAQYRSREDGAIANGSATLTVDALVPGAEGNAAEGTRLSLVSPVANVVSGAEAATAIAGGAEPEDDDSLRERLLFRIRAPLRGGTSADYVAWAHAAHPAVTRAWGRATASGLGTVTVYLMTDDETDDGIPQASVVKAVQSYIDQVRPVTADVTVAAPTAVALALTITNLKPATDAVKDAIRAELKDLIRRKAEPGGTILLSHIKEAISTSAGEEDHTLTAPTEDVEVEAAQITTLGEITWQQQAE